MTIDGPAGAGKSSIARALARRLGFRFLDTGAMYRAVALTANQRDVDWQDQQAIGQLAEQLDIQLDGQQVFVDGQDITDRIRNSEITRAIHYVADNSRVRRRLIEVLQTYFADNVKSRRLLSDGTYQPVDGKGKSIRAQEQLYREAVAAATAVGQPATSFQPMTRPQK